MKNNTDTQEILFQSASRKRQAENASRMLGVLGSLLYLLFAVVDDVFTYSKFY